MSQNSITLPGPDIQRVVIAYSKVPRESGFDPNGWAKTDLTRKADSWWEIDLSTLDLADGYYEYHFEIFDGQTKLTVPDPFAKMITRFNEYRGIFQIKNGERCFDSFSWVDELPQGKTLPNNNEIVIYELPVRWVDTTDDGKDRNIALGTFDKTLFQRLDYFADLGVNAIELLPIQDSPDTLNWGYGTRFFFSPDLDMGEAFDLKLFIKRCHQRNIRVILDIVMNHSRKCPLADLARKWYYVAEQEGRNSWGGELFWYDKPSYGDYYAARQFHYDMAEYWIREYHIDGFRIDEFNGIKNWDFMSEFKRRSWAVQQAIFPGRPFIVIAEDSARRPEVSQDMVGRAKVADAIWDFDFRDEVRRIVSNRLNTSFGKPSRSARVRAMLTGCNVINGDVWRNMWDGEKIVEARFTDLSQRIAYCSSHDVQEFNEQRLFPFLLEQFQNDFGRDWLPCTIAQSTSLAFEQHVAAFALTLTATGIPMFLAGDCFADLHDLNHSNWREKMQDPVDFERMNLPGHSTVIKRVRELIHLRTSHPALKRNETCFFGFSSTNPGFHGNFDNNDKERVFAYCRTGGMALGTAGQVVIIANCGSQEYQSFNIEWPWGGMQTREYAGISQPLPVVGGNMANLSLEAFQVRVFELG